MTVHIVYGVTRYREQWGVGSTVLKHLFVVNTPRTVNGSNLVSIHTNFVIGLAFLGYSPCGLI